MNSFKPYTLNIKGKIHLIDQPWVMGILNTTPDSFYDGAKHQTIDLALKQAEKMIKEGAQIIDVGGQSTRPKAKIINQDEELKRVLPFIEAVKKRFPDILLSIDTFKSKVAQFAIESGADIVNDIGAGEDDSEMLATVAALHVPYIAMHKKGSIQNMQENPQYNDVVQEVFAFLHQKQQTVYESGIQDLIIDLGFGFGKNLTHNYRLLNQLSFFHQLNCPILVGFSRKSMIYKPLEINAQDALNGTTVLHTLAVLQQAHILRVHDVKEAKEVIKLTQIYTNESKQ